MTTQVLLDHVAEEFAVAIGRSGEHVVVAGDETYIQPSVYLSFHLVSMRADGWRDVDFDDLAAVSGSSALFAYASGEFAPKYAHLFVDMDDRVVESAAVMPIPRPGEAQASIGVDRRIAAATGYGYEWASFDSAEEAWQLVTAGVDAGRALKGWYWDNVLFAGYRPAARSSDRLVFAIASGPDTFERWWTWDEFQEWVGYFEGWAQGQLGSHCGRVATKPAAETVWGVISDLVAWSTDPPLVVQKKFPNAAFGLAGIESYARDCADVDRYPDWVARHDVNGQWAARNSTAVYLERAADNVLTGPARAHLLAAAKEYRLAYREWHDVYLLLGHDAPVGAGRDHVRRESASTGVLRARDHEQAGVDALRRALDAVG